MQGEMTANKSTFEFSVTGIEISLVINNKTPGNLITVILLKDGTEVNRVEGTEYDYYLDYYPPVT
jgi:type V secretory pathway adhesin AidA